LAGLEADRPGRVSRAPVGWSGSVALSTSSAQLLVAALVSWAGALFASFVGVAEPDVGLLVVAGVEMPFAACAYENVDAIAICVYAT
jgi:hypothetical protein